MRNPAAGLVDIVLLDLLVLAYTVVAWRGCRPSAWLFIPYLLWLLFATYLNAFVWAFN